VGFASNIPVLRLGGGVTLTRGANGILRVFPPSSGESPRGDNGLLSFTSGANGPVTEVLDGKKHPAADQRGAIRSMRSNCSAATGTPFLTTEVTPIRLQPRLS